MGKKQKKTQECLDNIRIRFPTQENECYTKRTRILRTMPSTQATTSWAMINCLKILTINYLKESITI